MYPNVTYPYENKIFQTINCNLSPFSVVNRKGCDAFC